MAIEIEGNHYIGEVSQKAFIEKDGKVLMCRAFGFDKWDFPGGRLHKGETPGEGIVREVQEELGLDIVRGDAFFANVTTQTISGIPRYQIIFHASLTNPGQNLALAPDEIEDARWIGKEDVSGLVTWDDWKHVLEQHFGHA